MIRPDPNTERATLKLRDAFRILGWQCPAFTNEAELGKRYTKFGDFWQKSNVRSMDYFALTESATQLGFSVEELLIVRSNYYGLSNLAIEDREKPK